MTQEHRELTPPRAVIEVARAAMGAIDLDPWSTPEANRLVQAAQFLERSDDLAVATGRHWSPGGSRRLFLAVHSGIKLSRALANKVLTEYRGGHVREAILWFGCNEILTHCPWLWDFPICLPFKRLAPCFWDDELEEYFTVPPADWSAIVYLPPPHPSDAFQMGLARFHASTAHLGRIVLDERSGEGGWEEPHRIAVGTRRSP